MSIVSKVALDVVTRYELIMRKMCVRQLSVLTNLYR